MINETKAGKSLKKSDKKIIIDNLMKFCILINKYPCIHKLDINPLMFYKNSGVVIDARIAWGII